MKKLIENINWNWPKSETNSKYPWYAILWRVLICLPLILLGSLAMALGYALAGEFDLVKKVYTDLPSVN